MALLQNETRLGDRDTSPDNRNIFDSQRITGLQRCRGFLNLHVSFCKRAMNYRALLRKMTYEDKASYRSSPPCCVLMGHLLVCRCWNVKHQRSQHRCVQGVRKSLVSHCMYYAYILTVYSDTLRHTHRMPNINAHITGVCRV